MKRHLINFAKVAISVGIIVYLINDVQRNNPETFSQLVEGEKQWTLLAGAWALVTMAVMTTFVRWYFLVRTLGLPFTIRDAFRLGFLGYLLNFISLGSVGGDLFKAVFIAREQPGRRTEAVATVIIDRVIGLYGLLLVASFTILLMDVSRFNIEVRSLSQVTLVVTGVASVGLVALLAGVGTEGRLAKSLCTLRRGGAFFDQLFTAARTYRQRKGTLALALGMTLCVHSLMSLAFYFIARGLPVSAPGLGTHFLIIPLGLVAGAIPLPMGALGAFEMVMQVLYQQVGGGAAGDPTGLLVALTYRVVTILVALVGVAFYVSKRGDIDRAIHEVEEIEEEEALITDEV